MVSKGTPLIQPSRWHLTILNWGARMKFSSTGLLCCQSFFQTVMLAVFFCASSGCTPINPLSGMPMETSPKKTIKNMNQQDAGNTKSIFNDEYIKIEQYSIKEEADCIVQDVLITAKRYDVESLMLILSHISNDLGSFGYDESNAVHYNAMHVEYIVKEKILQNTSRRMTIRYPIKPDNHAGKFSLARPAYLSVNYYSSKFSILSMMDRELDPYSYKKVDPDKLGEYAENLDFPMMKMAYYRGGDINRPSSTGITPIFGAINGIRNLGGEFPKVCELLDFLIKNGADLEKRINPFPGAFDRPLTPEEFLKINVSKGAFNLRAPYAPICARLFQDKMLAELNQEAMEENHIADELGVSRVDLLKQREELGAIRVKDTFEGFREAFRISREKEDFQKAGQLAATPAQKKEMLGLAILALRDKEKIIAVSVGVPTGATPAPSVVNSKSYFDVFDFKSTTRNYRVNTQIALQSDSPVKLTYPCQVTIKFILTIDTERISNALFISTSTKETKDQTIRVTYEIGPKVRSSSHTLDFNNLFVANAGKIFFASSETKVTAANLTYEIERIELLP